MAAVAVCGEDAPQAEEGGGEFHGRWSPSWIGEGRCFGGTEFPHHLIQRTQHPPIPRRSQSEESATLSSSRSLLAAQVTSFVVLPKTMATRPRQIPILLCYPSITPIDS